MDVGQRLQQLRKMRGLSQRELAKRSGVTNSTISMIEKDEVSPSISSLKKVLSGIPISIADFFTVDFEIKQEPVYRAGELPDVGTRGVILQLIGANKKDRMMDIYREVYPPGADTGEELLRHDGEEGGIVLQGELELTVGFELYTLKEGDAYYFESSLPHRFRNIGDSELVIISSNAPPT